MRPTTSQRPVCIFAILSATSFASVPVLRSSTVERRREEPDEPLPSASTGSESIHEFRWTTSSSAERTAAAMRGWLWPSVEQICPDVKSRIRLPEAVSTHAPSARAIGSGARSPRIGSGSARARPRGKNTMPPWSPSRRTSSTPSAASRPRRPGRALPRRPPPLRARDGRGRPHPDSAASSFRPTSTSSSSTPAPLPGVEVEVELGEGHYHVPSSPPTRARSTAEAERGRAADLFQARSRFVEALAEEEDPLGHAREVLAGLPEEQRVEALAHHPRIGAPSLTGRSAAEQGADADPAVLAELAELNAAYEERFGFRFVVFVNRRRAPRSSRCCASGSSARARRSSRRAATSSSRSRWTGGGAPEDRLRQAGRVRLPDGRRQPALRRRDRR